MAFAYYSPVTVQSGQVSGTQTNFPMLVSYTDARLKTVGNGGHVQNANGFDIRPYTSSALSSAISYELERYNASTGEVVMWVNVASLAVGSVVYLAYGDSSLSTNGSSTAAWNTNYKAVYHLPDGTTLSANDSTSNANTGTVNSASATSGQMGGAALFSGSTSSYISAADSASLDVTGKLTVSCWVYTTDSTFTSFAGLVRKGDTGNDRPNNYMLQTLNDGVANKRRIEFTYAHLASDNENIGSVSNIAQNGWTYVAGVVDPLAVTTKFIYFNGVLDNSGNAVTPQAIIANAFPLWIGKRADAGFSGRIDEARVVADALSANWLLAEYNNQSAPGTFAVLGTEVPLVTSIPNRKVLVVQAIPRSAVY